MVSLAEMKSAVLILGLIALVAAAVSLALSEFQDSDAMNCPGCAAGNASQVSWNITQNGLVGVDNTTSFLGVIGTIIAVVALVTIVIGAFSVGKK